MKQKIEWYKEVLELEPGSRVFFPLAKLLARDGRPDEAVEIVRQGVLRHPDHVEARLLLVELLADQGEDGALGEEIDRLAGLFKNYPGFWNAWSSRLASLPQGRDAALALRFLASALQGRSISWASVIEKGLASSLEAELSASFPAGEISLPPASFADPALAEPAASEEPAFSASVPAASFSSESDFTDEEDAEEAFSLRTRSMAEVLAEQGDVAGAVDIYKELAAAADPAEKSSLERRLEELSARLGQPAQAAHASADVEEIPAGESNRLVSLLESLAVRLEARAR